MQVDSKRSSTAQLQGQKNGSKSVRCMSDFVLHVYFPLGSRSWNTTLVARKARFCLFLFFTIQEGKLAWKWKILIIFFSPENVTWRMTRKPIFSFSFPLLQSDDLSVAEPFVATAVNTSPPCDSHAALNLPQEEKKWKHKPTLFQHCSRSKLITRVNLRGKAKLLLPFFKTQLPAHRGPSAQTPKAAAFCAKVVQSSQFSRTAAAARSIIATNRVKWKGGKVTWHAADAVCEQRTYSRFKAACCSCRETQCSRDTRWIQQALWPNV